MPRPKTILWVDDEIDALGAHILFLQEHGYEVEPAAHGDDAIALLQRQPYGVILLDAMQSCARGPRQNGLFALWLFVRQCADTLPPHALSDRARGGRLAALEQRLSSLSLPSPLRRALPASIREMQTEKSDRVAVALQQLTAPTRESVGAPIAEVLGQAARTARQLVRETSAERSRA